MILTNVAGGVSMKKKTTKGRKKIEIKKIEETNSRQVTFSKRRTGLFKKASELCVLTGAQVAILVNSPGGRVFAFGHPNPDVLIDRYLNNNNNKYKDTTATADATAGATGGSTCKVSDAQLAGADAQYSPPPLPTKEFNRHYVEVSRELEAEKRRRELIPPSRDGLSWFEEPIDGLEVEELEHYLCSLVELKKKVFTRADELMMINKTPAMLGGPNVFEMGWNNYNNSIQTAGIPTNSTVHGGFIFQHGGEAGKF